MGDVIKLPTASPTEVVNHTPAEQRVLKDIAEMPVVDGGRKPAIEADMKMAAALLRLSGRNKT